MAAPLVEAAIERMRQLIASGEWRSGDRLPPEPELSLQLGVSRSSTREAVRALVAARVLDVRRGDGTYVTSLSPELLLEGIGVAVELMQEDAILELIEARRVIEPELTALAAKRAECRSMAEIRHHLALMRTETDQAALVRHDSDFHASVARASGNATLAAILIGLSSQTLRARVWRGSWRPTPTNGRSLSMLRSMQPLRVGIPRWPLLPHWCTSAPQRTGSGDRAAQHAEAERTLDIFDGASNIDPRTSDVWWRVAAAQRMRWLHHPR